MERVDLPRSARPHARHLLDWSPAPELHPDPELLNKLKKGRRSVRNGVAQSEISRQRQAFITGMNIYRMSGDEREAKARYIEEWQVRAVSND